MADEHVTLLDRCPPLPPVAERPLLGPEEARRLEAVFKVLANATRLRMLHALVREPDLSVGALAGAIGMKPQAVSNQLRRLADRGIVAPSRDGNHIRYRVVDACTVGLLDQGFCLVVCSQPRAGASAGAVSGGTDRARDPGPAT
ncbi:MAG: ArsR/SmtB family transcription factor [Planctomycetota bacterium]